MAQARALRERTARALRWRPEWGAAVIVAAAWVALVVGYGSHAEGSTIASDSSHHHQLQPQNGAEGALPGVLAALPLWAVMSLAMMTPAALPAVRHVGLNSVRRRRQWAMFLYVVVYLAVWVAFGLVAIGGVHFTGQTLGLDGRVLLALALTAAAGWQLTRWKRRAIYACRRTVPLPPIGLRADAGCVRFAFQQGARGVKSCWALMVVMAVVGHSSLVLMAALTALVVVEEETFVGRRLLSPSAGALALAAGVVIAGA